MFLAAYTYLRVLMLWILTYTTAASLTFMTLAILVGIRLANKLHRAEQTIHRLRREATVAYIKRHAAPEMPAWVERKPTPLHRVEG